MKKTFIKLIGATGLLPFAARVKTNAALVDAHTPESRMKLKVVSVIALVLGGVTAIIILPARATPQAGVSSVTIAHGSFDEIDVFAKTDLDPGNRTDYWKAMINTKGASHLYVLQNTVAPGGSFGWHSHTGPSLIIVMSGVATEYEGTIPLARPVSIRLEPHSLMPGKLQGTWCETMAPSTLWSRSSDSFRKAPYSGSTCRTQVIARV